MSSAANNGRKGNEGYFSFTFFCTLSNVNWIAAYFQLIFMKINCRPFPILRPHSLFKKPLLYLMST